MLRPWLGGRPQLLLEQKLRDLHVSNVTHCLGRIVFVRVAGVANKLIRPESYAPRLVRLLGTENRHDTLQVRTSRGKFQMCCDSGPFPRALVFMVERVEEVRKVGTGEDGA